jgi:hypothetical protein
VAQGRQASKSSGGSAKKSAGGGAGKSAAKSGGSAERGTTDVAYNLISVIYHALQGAETYGVYANDAEQDGNRQLADFFRQIQEDSLKRASHAKELLKRHL